MPVPPSVRNVMTPSVPNVVTPSVPNVQETASTSRSLYDLQDEPRGESVNVSVTRQSTSYSRSSYAENKDDPHVTFKVIQCVHLATADETHSFPINRGRRAVK